MWIFAGSLTLWLLRKVHAHNFPLFLKFFLAFNIVYSNLFSAVLIILILFLAAFLVWLHVMVLPLCCDVYLCLRTWNHSSAHTDIEEYLVLFWGFCLFTEAFHMSLYMSRIYFHVLLKNSNRFWLPMLC